MTADSLGYNAVPYVINREIANVEDAAVSGVITGVSGFSWAKTFTFVLDVTGAATAVGDTLNVYVQRELPGGGWDDFVSFTQVLGNGGTKTFIADVTPNPAAGANAVAAPTDATLSAGVKAVWPSNKIRVKYVIVDAGDVDAEFSFTVKVNARG